MTKEKILVITLVLFLVNGALSQAENKIQQNMPWHISLMKENISIPIVSPLKYSYHPALMIGTEYVLKTNKNHDLHLFGNLGYYYHKYWESTPFLDIGTGYRHHIKRFSFYPRLGIGYAHIFRPTPVYKFKEGQFKKVKDFGSPVFQSSFSMNIGFKLNKKELAPKLYITYMFAIQFPYNDFGGFHQFIGFGYQFHPFKNKS